MQIGALLIKFYLNKMEKMMRYLVFFLVFFSYINTCLSVVTSVLTSSVPLQDRMQSSDNNFGTVFALNQPSSEDLKQIQGFDWNSPPEIPENMSYDDLSLAQKLALLTGEYSKEWFSRLAKDYDLLRTLYYLYSDASEEEKGLSRWSRLSGISYWNLLQATKKVDWTSFFKNPVVFAKDYSSAYFFLLWIIDQNVFSYGRVNINLSKFLELIKNEKEEGKEDHVRSLIELGKRLGVISESAESFEEAVTSLGVVRFVKKVGLTTSQILWEKLASFETESRQLSIFEKIERFMQTNDLDVARMEFLLRYLWLTESDERKEKALMPLMHAFYKGIPLKSQKALNGAVKALVASLPLGLMDEKFTMLMIRSENFIVKKKKSTFYRKENGEE